MSRKPEYDTQVQRYLQASIDAVKAVRTVYTDANFTEAEVLSNVSGVYLIFFYMPTANFSPTLVSQIMSINAENNIATEFKV
jgi:hypothetical protein